MVCSGFLFKRGTGTGSVVECRAYGGLVLGLYWIVVYTEDRFLDLNRLKSIQRKGTGSIVNCVLYRGVVLCL